MPKALSDSASGSGRSLGGETVLRAFSGAVRIGSGIALCGLGLTATRFGCVSTGTGGGIDKGDADVGGSAGSDEEGIGAICAS